LHCPACGFQNIPGTQRCTRCQAQLLATEPAAAADLSPPRAGRLKGLRHLVYGLNRFIERRPRPLFERLGGWFSAASAVPGAAVAAAILSVVPGLGHLASGRRRAGLVAFLIWLILLTLTANFYAGATGGLLVGALVSWHAAVAYDAGRLQQHLAGVGERLRAMLLILLLAAIPYFALHRLARTYLDFVASPFTIESLDIRQGDTLLAWRGRHDADDVSPGDVVVFEVDREGYVQVGGVYFGFPGGVSVGRIIAAGGDRVAASPSGVAVNGVSVGAEELPGGPLRLPAQPLEVTVPENSVFIPVIFDVHGYDPPPQWVRALWQRLFVVGVRQMRGRVVGVYLPLRRRHFLRGAALPHGNAG